MVYSTVMDPANLCLPQQRVPEVDDAMTVCTSLTVLGAGVALRFAPDPVLIAGRRR